MAYPNNGRLPPTQTEKRNSPIGKRKGTIGGMADSIGKQTQPDTQWRFSAFRRRKNVFEQQTEIILKHIIPQTLSYAIVAMTLSVPSYILAESGLSFLGLGIQQPDASWGNMLKEAQALTTIIQRPLLLMPGLLIFVAVLAFNVIGDTIRDILDPKTKRI